MLDNNDAFQKSKNTITDFYIYDQTTLADSFFYQDSQIIRCVNVDRSINNYIDDLKKLCKEKENIVFEKTGIYPLDFSTTIKDEENENNDDFFRVHIINSVQGKIYQLRRIPDHVKTLDELNFDKGIKNLLLHENLKSGGLILITGETGQGKTTTCAAVIKERLALFKGFCLTVEDPPEYRLNGIFKKTKNRKNIESIEGEGVCVQTEAFSGKFDEAIKGAMRSYPVINNSLLYVGETRDQETAKEVLKIITNGHLVITTMHADSVFTAIKRLVSLASGGDQNVATYVADVLGSSIRLILHQKLEIKKIGIGDLKTERRLNVEFLYSPLSNGSAANAIRANNESQIKTIMNRQETILKSQGVNQLISEYNKITNDRR